MRESCNFANILFSGQCNCRCPYCIGGHEALASLPDNLSQWPLAGVDHLIEKVRRLDIRDISLSGTNTDPQLYSHEERLIRLLRRELPEVRLSLHTNGYSILRKLNTFNSYDRATISLASIRPETTLALTGRRRCIDLYRIVGRSRIPIKISVIVTDRNESELEEIIEFCRSLGIQRMVCRTLSGDSREWDVFPQRTPVRIFSGNPVYEVSGMEITVWNFDRSHVFCLNLLSDGRLYEQYRLTEVSPC